MKRLSKQQQSDIAAAVEACSAATEILEKEIDAFNEAMAPLKEKIEEAVTAYNEKVQELKGIYEEIGSEAREFFNDRSDRWQEGEAGQAYGEWADQLESVDLEEISMELPDNLQLPSEVPDWGSIGDFLPPDEPGA